MPASAAAPQIDVSFPDLSRWIEGNAGIPYVWRFAAAKAGPSLTVQALTHGNEVCGAIALSALLGSDIRPLCGTLTLIFANVDAYLSFDPIDPYTSRCLDEDFNRLWTPDLLDGTRTSRELVRARALRPCYDATDYLLDLHSMTDPCPPLALAGRQPKGVALARQIGIPQHIVIDAGHRSGKRLRDYAFFDDPDDPRSALLIECGQHWERSAPRVAMQSVLRFLRQFGMASNKLLEARLDTEPVPPQRAIEVTDIVTIATDRFEFVQDISGLQVVKQRGTLLAMDDDIDIYTPYDDCVLIMPTRRPRKGETAVRLGRFIE